MREYRYIKMIDEPMTDPVCNPAVDIIIEKK